MKTIFTASGPPIIIPTVPERNTSIAFQPNFLRTLLSKLRVNKNKQTGYKYFETNGYMPDFLPENRFKVFKTPGTK